MMQVGTNKATHMEKKAEGDSANLYGDFTVAEARGTRCFQSADRVRLSIENGCTGQYLAQ